MKKKLSELEEWFLKTRLEDWKQVSTDRINFRQKVKGAEISVKKGTYYKSLHQELNYLNFTFDSSSFYNRSYFYNYWFFKPAPLKHFKEIIEFHEKEKARQNAENYEKEYEHIKEIIS
jgi:hypothetical protein